MPSLALLRAAVTTAAIVMCLAVVAWALVEPARDEPALRDARFLLADDEMPPANSRAWTAVTLPDNWSVQRPTAQGIGWYRLALDLGSAPPARVAVLVPRLSMNGDFFLNGVRVLSGGSLQEPVTRNWNTPFYVELPASLLQPGPNRLDIRLFAYRNNNGGLGRVYWGDATVLQPYHRTLQALHVKGAVMSFAVAVVAAFIGLATWLRMQRGAAYGLFGLAMLAWAVRYANYFVQDVPFDSLPYSVAVNSAQGWFFIFFTPFLLRLSRIRWPHLEWALIAVGVAGTLGIYAAYRGLADLRLVVGLWMCVWIPGSIVLLAVSARNAWRVRTVPALMACIVAWLYVPLTAREVLITTNLMPFDSSYVAHYVGMPLALLIAWMLVERVFKAVQATARAELERTRAAHEERLRITQDMHDGLGLQLNAALREAERGRLDPAHFGERLRACLDELRLIVDSSAPQAGEFLPLLASLRHRLQPRLQAIGIELRWQMDGLPFGLVLAPAVSLQVLRIVQEAINNTIKHAQARHIDIALGQAARPGEVVLLVRDDGHGFQIDGVHGGRGLGGMQRRATAAGVGLAIRSTPEGTTIELRMPLPAAASSTTQPLHP